MGSGFATQSGVDTGSQGTSGVDYEASFVDPSDDGNNTLGDSMEQAQFAASFEEPDSDDEAILNNKVENYEAAGPESAVRLLEIPPWLTSFRRKDTERYFLFTQCKKNKRRNLFLFSVIAIFNKVILGYYFFFQGTENVKVSASATILVV